MLTVDERAKEMLFTAIRAAGIEDNHNVRREAQWIDGPSHTRRLEDAALAALTTAINQLDEARAELAAEREKFTMHTAEVGAWLALLTEVFGIEADNVRDACSKVYDAAKEARAVALEAAEKQLNKSMVEWQKELGLPAPHPTDTPLSYARFAWQAAIRALQDKP